MYMPPGTAYVYMLYYGYYCFNISSQEPGGVVLIRALEPIHGENSMRELKNKNSRSKSLKYLQSIKLCNGPSKLCMSFSITKENTNKVDLTSPMNQEIWIETSDLNQEFVIISSSRIGLGKTAAESANVAFRYYILHNASVSKIDRDAENKILSKQI